MLFRLGYYHSACLARCFIHGTVASVALWMMSVMLLATHRASSALPVLLRSIPYSVIVYWNIFQLALYQPYLGGDIGGVWLM
jgi:hypothetical protein